VSDQFLGEIRIFGCNFAPVGWATCNGQILPISQNTALFSLLGTFYGGDGKSAFALPDLQGNAPMFWGDGSGLSQRSLGEQSGVPSVTLLQTEMPAHPHTLNVSGEAAVEREPGSQKFATGDGVSMYDTNAQPTAHMSFQGIGFTGGGLPHNNMQPYLTINFCIALQGAFPQRP
jgi:microcystin-dependent protein